LSYTEIPSLGSNSRQNSFFDFAARYRDDRPAVAIVLAAVTETLGQRLVPLSYTYLVVLQFLNFFSSLFFLANTLLAAGRRHWPAIAGAAGVTIGFPVQFVVDINAWSELSIIPVAILAVALFIILLAPSPPIHRLPRRSIGKWCVLLGILAASIFYLYPESAVMYGAMAIGALAIWLWKQRNTGVDVNVIATVVAALGSGLALCLPYVQGTLGMLWRQMNWASTHSPNWWLFFQRYLLPDETWLPKLAPPLQWLAIYPGDMGLGVLGLYFLLPHSFHGPKGDLEWHVFADVLLVFVLAATFKSFYLLQAESGPTGLRSKLFAGAIGGAVIVLVLTALSGRFWAAGKGLSMVGPFLFFPLMAPLFIEARHASWTRLSAGVVLVAYIGFGLARPVVAVTSEGVGYPLPYPSSQDPDSKLRYDWDLEKRSETLRRCSAIAVDVENPGFERFVQLYLSELGVRWFSVRPLNSYFGSGPDLGMQQQLPNPDCLLTTAPQVPAGGSATTIISLVKKH
jgi:hypothetical protein